MVIETVLILAGVSVFFILSFTLFRVLLMKKIRLLLLDFPRLDHKEVLETRKEQAAVPSGFDTWPWTSLEFKSPWRGPQTLEWSPGTSKDKTVLFVHGTATNRFSMIRYMRPYREMGFNLVFYDHPGHGLHRDPPPSYGWYEKGELDFIVNRMKEVFPGTKLWVFHGESLGAGTILDYLGTYPSSGTEHRLGIADCGYTDFSLLLIHHLKLWKLPPVLFPWILKNSRKLLLNRSLAPLEGLKPGIAALASRDPLLLIHGLEDIRVPASMSQELYESRKDLAYTELHLVPNARHCRCWQTDPDTYDDWVRMFIQSQGGKSAGN